MAMNADTLAIASFSLPWVTENLSSVLSSEFLLLLLFRPSLLLFFNTWMSILFYLGSCLTPYFKIVLSQHIKSSPSLISLTSFNFNTTTNNSVHSSNIRHSKSSCSGSILFPKFRFIYSTSSHSFRMSNSNSSLSYASMSSISKHASSWLS